MILFFRSSGLKPFGEVVEAVSAICFQECHDTNVLCAQYVGLGRISDF